MKNKAKIGIIGGSGLYNIEGMENIRQIKIKTPFGMPSGNITIGTLKNTDITFISRHGKGHVINPFEINYRANIYALKLLGVKSIISISAVGSLKENLKPGDLVLIDQFFDNTKSRVSTFFRDGIVAHVSLANPICENLTNILYKSAKKLNITTHKGGTYLCMEGPQFSTKAESNIYRKLGFDVIGMTNATEAKLSREAEICYASLCFVTDYDCWHDSEENVSVEMVLKILLDNAEKGKKILKESIKNINAIENCECRHSLKNAIITNHSSIPTKIKKRLSAIIGEYI
ncbi:S-methyl-5'-thioadenosine phosphorylase [bacterium]